MRNGGAEVRAVQVFAHAGFEALEGGDERFRRVAAAERAEAATGIWEFSGKLVREQMPRVDLRS